MTARPVQFIHAMPTDQEILILWRAGKDTLDIARQLWVPEHHVAIRLPGILARARQDQEWNFDRHHTAPAAAPPRPRGH